MMEGEEVSCGQAVGGRRTAGGGGGRRVGREEGVLEKGRRAGRGRARARFGGSCIGTTRCVRRERARARRSSWARARASRKLAFVAPQPALSLPSPSPARALALSLCNLRACACARMRLARRLPVSLTCGCSWLARTPSRWLAVEAGVAIARSVVSVLCPMCRARVVSAGAARRRNVLPLLPLDARELSVGARMCGVRREAGGRALKCCSPARRRPLAAAT